MTAPSDLEEKDHGSSGVERAALLPSEASCSAAQSGAGWVFHAPGGQIPAGRVRIRHDTGWESKSFADAYSWQGWDTGVIAAYLPEAPPPLSARPGEGGPAMAGDTHNSGGSNE